MIRIRRNAKSITIYRSSSSTTSTYSKPNISPDINEQLSEQFGFYVPARGVLDAILPLGPTENNFSEFDEIGFIAQDVEGALSTELFAKAVVKKLDEDKEDSALGLMTEKFIPILVKAIQEQQALIKALEQRIINLENK